MLEIITLNNTNGAELVISNYGATILSLKVPDKKNNLVNVVVGLKSPEDYLEASYQNHNLLLGSSVGRYAGRISGKELNIEGKTYPLHHKNGVHLHGGKQGFDKKFWNIDRPLKSSVKLSYLSRHLEENYPGNLQVSVLYELLESNSLKITYEAYTDRTTVLNLTNHAYFNLNGNGGVLDHQLQIHSNRYLDMDDQLIPTGLIVPSEQTRFDYSNLSQIKKQGFTGLDNVFILKQEEAATLQSSRSGISMRVITQQPAMVIYTPKSFPNLNFSNNVKFGRFPAICFEAQNFSDAPNKPHFPTSLLQPGQLYVNESLFEFGVMDS